MQREYQEVSIQDLEEDILSVTGDAVHAKSTAQAYAIYYKNVVTSSIKYRKGYISDSELVYSRNVQWEHMRAHSKKLAENMRKAGRGDKPEGTAAHHIVSWNDIRASKARLRLAAFGIDIDHEANGVYLPLHKAHIPMKSMPRAYAHSTIHTEKYYLNVEFLIDEAIQEGLGHRGILDTLRDIANGLQKGTFPIDDIIDE
ncbi:hypothetical protein MSP8886_00536 [Marinomonas spartinae]|uniref:A nuclease family of the HNH/ENDO VII superfamily with conserved AHH n=1 Tax=Marinomonas spartinae TaxID=1792290 RepID=A0A1A8T2E5_9GAMM|nr:AHH domain-containing protein [Marinomonas spartinae]SBS26216.1 hypothetical protein MSP8886_00536 [Marinomonas spartinae]